MRRSGRWRPCPSGRCCGSCRELLAGMRLRDAFLAAGLLGADLATRPLCAADAKAADSQSPYPGGASAPGNSPRDHFQQFKPKLRITKLETFLVKPRWLFLKNVDVMADIARGTHLPIATGER